jgi:hypothetical protein
MSDRRPLTLVHRKLRMAAKASLVEHSDALPQHGML